MVDLRLSRVIIPRPEAKKKKRPRVVYGHVELDPEYMRKHSSRNGGS